MAQNLLPAIQYSHQVDATDNSLMQAVCQGDVAQLAVLFERYHRPLFRYLVAMTRSAETAEDLVQDVFFRLLRHRVSFDGKQAFLPWMYRIARNACTDHFRKRHGEETGGVSVDQLVEMGAEPATPAADPERAASRAEDLALLHGALQRLPEDKRELLVLARFQGLKHEEMAQILGCEVAVVKGRLFRAMRALERVYFTLAEEGAS